MHYNIISMLKYPLKCTRTLSTLQSDTSSDLRVMIPYMILKHQNLQCLQIAVNTAISNGSMICALCSSLAHKHVLQNKHFILWCQM